MLGGVVPPSNSRARLPNCDGDIQLTSMQLLQQLGRTTLTLGKINTVDRLAGTPSTTDRTQVPQSDSAVGYFYYNLSDALQRALDPLLTFYR
jgi:hypothetical protein